MSDPEEVLPYLSAAFPGVGGKLRTSPEDFRVEEIPAYQPCGEGEHWYLWFEKRELTTPNLLKALSQNLEIKETDIGAAGMKDKFAVTRQWISIPGSVEEKALTALEIPGATLLERSRHGNKLKTGHLKGNRFILKIRDLNCPLEEASTRAEAIAELLSKAPGAPNWYGAQRFGRDGKNARIGKDLLQGSTRGPKGRQRRLYVSAYQSLLFNRYLCGRMKDDCYSSLIAGELLQKCDSGAGFASEDLEEESHRFSQGLIVATGPMFGYKMKSPAEGSDAALREERLLSEEELTKESFRALGKIAQGTRRALSIPLSDISIRIEDEALELAFSLPSGSYATAVMREFMKGPENFPN